MKKYRIRPNSIADRAGEILVSIALLIGLTFLIASSIQPKEVTEELPDIEITTDNYTYNVPLASELQLYIKTTCDEYGVDPALVIAMIGVESSYDADAIGDGGDSVGLMQVQEKWHGERMARLGASDLMNPYENVTVGIDYIAEQLAQGKGIEWALHAYNGGVQYADEMTASGQVSDYAAKVMAEAYKLTYERRTNERLDRK